MKFKYTKETKLMYFNDVVSILEDCVIHYNKYFNNRKCTYILESGERINILKGHNFGHILGINQHTLFRIFNEKKFGDIVNFIIKNKDEIKDFLLKGELNLFVMDFQKIITKCQTFLLIKDIQPENIDFFAKSNAITSIGDGIVKGDFIISLNDCDNKLVVQRSRKNENNYRIISNYITEDSDKILEGKDLVIPIYYKEVKGISEIVVERNYSKKEILETLRRYIEFTKKHNCRVIFPDNLIDEYCNYLRTTEEQKLQLEDLTKVIDKINAENQILLNNQVQLEEQLKTEQNLPFLKRLFRKSSKIDC